MRNIIKIRISHKRLAVAILGLAALILADLLMQEQMLKFCLATGMVFLLGSFEIKICGRAAGLIWLPVTLAAALCAIVFVQLVNECALPDMHRLLLGTECAFVIMLLFGCVFCALLPSRDTAAKIAITLACIVILALGVINFYTFYSRYRGIAPTDIMAVGTAITVLDNYTFAVTARMIQAIVGFIAGMFFISGISTDSAVKKLHSCAVLLMFTALVTLHCSFCLRSTETFYNTNEGCQKNGLILNLCAQLQNDRIKDPENYSPKYLAELEEHYGAAAQQSGAEAANIIVIMNETFADLRVWGEFDTDIAVMPFLDELKEDTVRGNVLASVVGGTTPNSEYEFITGNSLFFLTPGLVPYQQLIYNDSYSLERYLNSLGYDSFYTHPCRAENWGRLTVYPRLGFERAIYEDGYEGALRYRSYISDQAVYDKLIEEYERGEGRKMLFAVTMQNHGGYRFEVDFEEPVSLTDYSMPDAEQYLSSIHLSDIAIERLINYFREKEEPVVILMFGDHQPSFADDFGLMLGHENTTGFDVDMTLYTVPFYLWANYDIEEQYVELTSLNFLSNYLLKTAGLPMSPYNSFLEDVQEVIPAMNAYGYWSDSLGRFAGYDEAEGEEKQWLQDYEILQYNSLFDKKNRSEVFFPEN